MVDNNKFYINEAFKRLRCLDEEAFDLTGDVGKTDELQSFVSDDIDAPEEEVIIDTEAETPEDLQGSYVGKVIMECDCCHSRLYKDISEVFIDEDTQLANVDEECPVCGGTFGYSVIGKIEAFDASEAGEESVDEVEPEEIEDEPEFSDDEIGEAFREALNELSDEDKAELENSNVGESSLSEELLDHGNTHDEFKADGGIASDDTKSLEDDQTELVHSPEENIKSLTEEDHGDEEHGDEHHHGHGEHHHHDHHDHDCDCEESCNEAKECPKCGKSPCECDKGLNEDVTIDMNNGTVTTDSADIDISSGTISAGSASPESTEEMIAPLGDEEVAEIEANIPADDALLDDDAMALEEPMDDMGGEEEMSMEEPVEGEFDPDAEPDEAEDEFQEESFNYLGESFLRRVYENVNSFKTTSVSMDGTGKLVIEGVIKFDSGKERSTEFVFNESKITKRGKVIYEGSNSTFSNSDKAFRLKTSSHSGVMFTESLTYSYTTNTINESNEAEVVRVNGRVVNERILPHTGKYDQGALDRSAKNSKDGKVSKNLKPGMLDHVFNRKYVNQVKQAERKAASDKRAADREKRNTYTSDSTYTKGGSKNYDPQQKYDRYQTSDSRKSWVTHKNEKPMDDDIGSL